MSLSHLAENFVAPFYLDMMRLNAIQHGGDLVAELTTAGRLITDDDVVTLLRSDWRERVMGAWFATLHDDSPAVRQALLVSLETSAGSLTSPPLASVAALLMGTDALESLRRYRAADVSNEWGGAGFIDATIEHLGAEPVVGSEESLARPGDRSDLVSLLDIAERLRSQSGGR